jgi:hypothetical protein
MKIKTSELTDAALDWAVAKCEGLLAYGYKDDAGLLLITLSTGEAEYFIPTMKWEQGGPIIERKKISIIEECDGTWTGSIGGCTDLDMPLYQEHGLTQLISAMRCYVASELGDEVEIPEELT